MKKIYNNKIDSLYLCNYKHVTNFNNWSFNRPLDPLRVSEIEVLLKSKNEFFNIGIIYVALINGNYIVYDGGHRFNALLNVADESIEFLVFVSNCKSDNNIHKRFILLNKSVPVSSLYTEQVQNKYKSIVEYIVMSLVTKFPAHFSSAKNPRPPNTNRDKLTDQLYQYLQDENIVDSPMQLLQKILTINTELSRKLDEPKSKKTGCYLFNKHSNLLTRLTETHNLINLY
jgi:hypothetical protein